MIYIWYKFYLCQGKSAPLQQAKLQVQQDQVHKAALTGLNWRKKSSIFSGYEIMTLWNNNFHKVSPSSQVLLGSLVSIVSGFTSWSVSTSPKSPYIFLPTAWMDPFGSDGWALGCIGTGWRSKKLGLLSGVLMDTSKYCALGCRTKKIASSWYKHKSHYDEMPLEQVDETKSRLFALRSRF